MNFANRLQQVLSVLAVDYALGDFVQFWRIDMTGYINHSVEEGILK
jgi:hypothetical protein